MCKDGRAEDRGSLVSGVQEAAIILVLDYSPMDPMMGERTKTSVARASVILGLIITFSQA